MKKRSHNFLSLSFLIILSLNGQIRLYHRLCPTENSIQLKWYGDPLISNDTYDVFRREGNNQWLKINPKPIGLDSFKLSQLKNDSNTLIANAARICEYKPIVSLLLLNTVLASIRSQAFSDAIGISFEDTSIIHGRRYRYQLRRSEIGSTTIEAETPEILTSNQTREKCPQNIHSKIVKKRVSFSWQDESLRYYGVNVYRRHADSNNSICLTRQPLLFSGQENPSGEFAERFIDQLPSYGGKYYYSFSGVDFFETATERSPEYFIAVPDQEGPPSPAHFMSTNKGRQVHLQWEGTDSCADLKLYQLFRTNKNDSDFTLRRTILPVSGTYRISDSVPHFQSYSYRLTAVDQSGNASAPAISLITISDLEPPAAPKNISLRSDSATISLKWDKNSEEDLSGYLIYRSIDDTVNGNFVKITANPVTDNHFIDQLPGNAKNNFHYKIFAIDNNLNKSIAGNIVAGRLPDFQPPSAPFLCSAVEDQKGITLIWFQNPEKDLLCYSLYVQQDSGSARRITLSKKFTKHTISNPKNGAYYFWINAIDSSGNLSSFSNTVSIIHQIKTDKSLPEIEIRHRIKKKSNLLKLAWKLTNDDTATYIVLRKEYGESVFYPLKGDYQENKSLETHINGREEDFQIRAYLADGTVIRSVIIKIKNPKHEQRKNKKDWQSAPSSTLRNVD